MCMDWRGSRLWRSDRLKPLGYAAHSLMGKVPYSGENHRMCGKYDVLGASRGQIDEHTRGEDYEENKHIGDHGDIHCTTVNFYFTCRAHKIKVFR